MNCCCSSTSGGPSLPPLWLPWPVEGTATPTRRDSSVAMAWSCSNSSATVQFSMAQRSQSFDEKNMWIFQKLREKSVKNFFPLKILCTTKESTAPEFWRWRFAQLAETLWAAEQVEQAELRKKRAKWATKKSKKHSFIFLSMKYWNTAY